MSETVWVELNKEVDHSRCLRIFRSRKAAIAATGAFIAEWLRAEAILSIRRQIFFRSKGYCEDCGDLVTWNSGHMHERVWRGKGGEISLENSFFICAKTHKREHRERAPQFTRRQS